MRNLRDKLKEALRELKKQEIFSGFDARDILLNPGDRKGLTMNFDRLKHPFFLLGSSCSQIVLYVLSYSYVFNSRQQ